MNRLYALILTVSAAVIVGCGGVSPRPDHVAITKLLGDGTYEVQLRYSETYSGGPCLSKDWFKTRTSYTTNWVFVNQLVGDITADRLTVTIDASRKDWPYAMTNLHGTVLFTNGLMIVRLQQPDVDSDGNAMKTYIPFYLNGTYQTSEEAH